MSAPHPSVFARATEAATYLRGPGRAAAIHREWLHFVVHDAALDLLVNFSVTRFGGKEWGQLLLLVRDPAGAWEGDVVRLPTEAIELGRGAVRMRLGESWVVFDGAFRLRAHLPERHLSVDLTVEPRCFPYLIQNAGPADDAPIHWTVAPRLVASGAVVRGGRVFALREAAAYHDHNWGAFAGRDLAWDWCCTLAGADSPWSIVFVRLLDRARARVFSQGVLVWDGAHRAGAFRSPHVQIREEGMRRTDGGLRVPRGLGFVAPPVASFAARVRVTASAGDDWLIGSVTTSDAARVLVPRDTDSGTAVLKEIVGRASFEGRIHGRSVAFESHAFLEMVGECR
jgi:hypothetical protein